MLTRIGSYPVEREVGRGGIGEAEGKRFLVLELVEGETLAHRGAEPISVNWRAGAEK